METALEKYKNRQQWFIDRIGKRVFRTKQTCKCETCEAIFNNGIVIEDRDHAIYLHDVENDLHLTTYYETKEEVPTHI